MLGTNQKCVYDFVSKNLSVGLSKAWAVTVSSRAFDYRRIVVTGNSFADSSGSFTFNGVFTVESHQPDQRHRRRSGGFSAGYPSSGDGLLTIKLELPDYLAGYLQDDIRISRRLTPQFGLALGAESTASGEEQWVGHEF